jgi:hypothetical protein
MHPLKKVLRGQWVCPSRGTNQDLGSHPGLQKGQGKPPLGIRMAKQGLPKEDPLALTKWLRGSSAEIRDPVTYLI